MKLKISFLILTTLFIAPFYGFCNEVKTSITSAEKYLTYLRSKKDFPTFDPPETVIFIYSSALLEEVLVTHPHEQGTSCFSELYLIENGKVGVCYIRGMGSPALIHRMEELIAFGVKKFISVGFAGTLTKDLSLGDFVIYEKALSEDGAGRLYMDSEDVFSYADKDVIATWNSFMTTKHPHDAPFKPAVSWSFPVLFKETEEDVLRVKNLGCTTVEMEIAGFFAIAKEKDVQPLALYVISDSLADGEWDPHIKDPSIKQNRKKIIDLAIEFSQEKP